MMFETEEKFIKHVKCIFIETEDSYRFKEPTTYQEAVEYLNDHCTNYEFIKPNIF